jgi:hypothetical protein
MPENMAFSESKVRPRIYANTLRARCLRESFMN